MNSCWVTCEGLGLTDTGGVVIFLVTSCWISCDEPASHPGTSSRLSQATKKTLQLLCTCNSVYVEDITWRRKDMIFFSGVNNIL